MNGAAPFPDLSKHCLESMTSLLHVTTEFEEFYQQRHSIYAPEYRRRDIAPNASLEELDAARRRQRRIDARQCGRNGIDMAWEILGHLH